jgi:diaminopimelate decarboxylase
VTFRDPALDYPHFSRRDGELCCEQVSLAELAKRHGTPLYVYSKAAMVERFGLLRDAFGPDAEILFAVKSNANLGLLRLFADLGAGFDIVSVGELRRIQAAGLPTDAVVFAGIAKQEREIDAAIEAGIRFFNLESAYELGLLEAAGKRAGVEVPLAVRLNPDVDAGTHAYISTGKKENKFGVDFDTAARVVERIAASEHLRLRGYHVHLGSQLRSVDPYLMAFDRVETFLDGAEVRRAGVTHYDLGGGFGVSYGDGRPPCDVAELARRLGPRIRARGLTPVLEPGRFLVADAGILLTEVFATKHGVDRAFLVVDAAMNDLMRPSLYGAEHPMAPVRGDRLASARGVFDVVGPVCETGDFLARDRELPELASGDLLAVFAAGAYGSSMASNYNSRPRPAEVLVDGRTAHRIRRRERYEDLWQLEIDP